MKMKRFLTVLMVVAVLFTFSFSGALAKTTFPATTANNAMEASDYLYATPGTGTVGVTALQVSNEVARLEAVVKGLAKTGTYTYANTTTEVFTGAHLEEVKGYVASALEAVKAAKTSAAINKIVTDLDTKVRAEFSRDELVGQIITDANNVDITTSFATGTATYLLPGYAQFAGNAQLTIVDADASVATNAANFALKWFLNNDYDTAEKIKSKAAQSAFEDALVEISSTATDATIYDNSSSNLNSAGLVYYYQAAALEDAVKKAATTDIEAVYSAVKAYKAFEAANVAGTFNEDNYLTAAVTYYGAVNFDSKCAAIKKLSAKEVVAKKDEVIALAEAIVAFEDKYGLDIYGSGKTYNLTTEFGYIENAGDDAVEEAAAIVATVPENLTTDDKADVEALAAAYDAYKAEYTKDIYEGIASNYVTSNGLNTEAWLLAAKANLAYLAKADDFDATAIQNYLNNATVKVTTQALGKGRVRAKATIDTATMQALTAALQGAGDGYNFEYKFYYKKAANTAYKAGKDKTVNYTTFKLAKGTKYNFRVAVTIKDIDGNVIATTPYMNSTVGTRTVK